MLTPTATRCESSRQTPLAGIDGVLLWSHRPASQDVLLRQARGTWKV
jgi:hypothetical protein